MTKSEKPSAKTSNYLVSEVQPSNLEIIKGIPKRPVLVLEFISKSSISPFVARNAVWGGISLVVSSNAPERASRTLLRPTSNIIELGLYKNGDYDILDKLKLQDGYIRRNGVLVQTNLGKSDYISNLCQQLGIRRAMLHLQNPQLITAMENMGLQVYESLQVYQNLGKKSNFNKALEEFSNRYPKSTIGKFGVDFNNLDEIADEVSRLSDFKARACVKFDETLQGSISDSGLGVYFIPDFYKFGSKNKFKNYMMEQLKKRNFKGKELKGLVQMYIPNSPVLSVSSGQIGKEYFIYEAHTQTQFTYLSGKDKVTTADGALPLKNDQYTNELLTLIWPQLTQFYIENEVTGDQNMNFIIIPPDRLELARKIYNNNRMSAIVPIDLNPRSISGTKRIMGRFSEETLESINWLNYAARSLHMDHFFAANPHLIYRAASSLGLRAGIGGNISFTNFGTLIPERIRKQQENITIKVFVQNTPNPTEILLHLEEIIRKPPSTTLVKGLDTKKPKEIPDADKDQEYELWLRQQFKKVLFI